MTKISTQPTVLGAPAASPSLSRRQLLASATLVAAAASTGMVPGKAAAAQVAASNPDMGAVWWSELQTADPARARPFYAAVMGWTPKIVALNDQSRPPAADEKEYTLFTVDGHETAGAVRIDDGLPDVTAATWVTYIQVANVDLAALKAVELGGKLLEPPADVPNTGRIAVIEDLEGVRVGLITPVAAASG